MMKTRMTAVLVGALLLLPGAAAVAAEAPGTVGMSGVEGASVGSATRLLQFVGNSFSGAGAPFLWAILMVSAFAVTVTVEKAYFLFVKGVRGDRDMFEHVVRLVRDRRIEEARTVTERSNTPFARILRTVLTIRHGHRHEEMQNLIDEAYLREVPAFQRRVPLLAVTANLATLLGLLGTIVGLIMAFDAVAHVAAAQRTAALAAGISVAMATTGFGLIVAIPTLAAHGFLGSRSERAVEEIESRLAVLANLVQEWNRVPQDDPYEETKTGIEERRERLVDYVVTGQV